MSDEPYAEEIAEAQALIARLRKQLGDVDRQRKERRREYSRAYYAKNREQQREYQRKYRQKKQQEDPERYRAQRRARSQRSRDKHRDEINAVRREKYRANPEPHRDRRKRDYAAEPEKARARRRETYSANRVQEREAQKRYRDRRRREQGLDMPRTALHPATTAERRANAAAADAFFARARSASEIATMSVEAATPPELLAAWERDCRRARAVSTLVEHGEELQRLQSELGRVSRRRAREQADREAEEARLDAIGKTINDRLRLREAPRRPQQADPAAPHPYLEHPNQTGLQR